MVYRYRWYQRQNYPHIYIYPSIHPSIKKRWYQSHTGTTTFNRLQCSCLVIWPFVNKQEGFSGVGCRLSRWLQLEGTQEWEMCSNVLLKVKVSEDFIRASYRICWKWCHLPVSHTLCTRTWRFGYQSNEAYQCYSNITGTFKIYVSLQG